MVAMTDSILQKDKECYLCRKFFGISRQIGLERHHVMNGVANRKLSEKYGLVVWLCQRHHNTAPDGVHFNSENMRILKRDGQKSFEKSHTHEEYMRTFGVNYDFD